MYMFLVGEPEGKRQLGRSRDSCVDDIKIDLVEREWCGIYRVGLVQDRKKWGAVLNAVMNFRIP
jgi:hypothetical protein